MRERGILALSSALCRVAYLSQTPCFRLDRFGSFASILACPQHVRLGVNLGNADCPILPGEGIGSDVIQALKSGPRIMRHELTDFELVAIRPFLPNSRVAFPVLTTGASHQSEFGCGLMGPRPSCSFIVDVEAQLAAASRTRRHARPVPWALSCRALDESISPRRHSRMTKGRPLPLSSDTSASRMKRVPSEALISARMVTLPPVDSPRLPAASFGSTLSNLSVAGEAASMSGSGRPERTVTWRSAVRNRRGDMPSI